MEKSAEVPPPYSDAPGAAQGQPGYPPNYNQGYATQYNYPPQAGQYGGHQYPPPAGQYPPQGGQYPPQGGPPGQYPPQGGPPPPPGYQPQYQYGNVVVQQPMTMAVNQGPPPPDHMCAAIFVTLCCFWPTGIVAIMRASDARAAMARGDMMGANSYAGSAKSMITISVVIGIIAVIVMAIIIGVYVGVILQNIHDYDSY